MMNFHTPLDERNLCPGAVAAATPTTFLYKLSGALQCSLCRLFVGVVAAPARLSYFWRRPGCVAPLAGLCVVVRGRFLGGGATAVSDAPLILHHIVPGRLRAEKLRLLRASADVSSTPATAPPAAQLDTCGCHT